MKMLLEQTKSVLESKISEIDQHLEKTDMITTNVDSTTSVRFYLSIHNVTSHRKALIGSVL
jgi:hypothetical protein